MAKINEKISVPTPHISAKRGEIAETILLPGDPLRAKFIADTFLSDVKQFNAVRNMLGFSGYFKGKFVSVMGTGMGCPSMAIYSHELIFGYGVKNLIRIGTAGSMQPFVHARDLVIAQGCCTDSGYPMHLGLNGVYAPIASFKLLKKASEIAKEKGYPYHVGNIFSGDAFYGVDTHNGLSFVDMGCLAGEMETAALYTNAALGKVDALTIVTISDGPEEITTPLQRERAFTAMMEVALGMVE